jgi:hypothetical protein
LREGAAGAGAGAAAEPGSRRELGLGFGERRRSRERARGLEREERFLERGVEGRRRAAEADAAAPPASSMACGDGRLEGIGEGSAGGRFEFRGWEIGGSRGGRGEKGSVGSGAGVSLVSREGSAAQRGVPCVRRGPVALPSARLRQTRVKVFSCVPHATRRVAMSTVARAQRAARRSWSLAPSASSPWERQRGRLPVPEPVFGA